MGLTAKAIGPDHNGWRPQRASTESVGRHGRLVEAVLGIVLTPGRPSVGPTASDIARRPPRNQSRSASPRSRTPHALPTVTHDSATSTSACGSRLTITGAGMHVVPSAVLLALAERAVPPGLLVGDATVASLPATVLLSAPSTGLWRSCRWRCMALEMRDAARGNVVTGGVARCNCRGLIVSQQTSVCSERAAAGLMHLLSRFRWTQESSQDGVCGSSTESRDRTSYLNILT